MEPRGVAMGRRFNRFCNMVNQILRWAAVLVWGGALCLACYEIGKSKAEIKYVEKKVEVIRYAEKKRAKIYSQPNAGRDVLLKLMHDGKL